MIYVTGDMHGDIERFGAKALKKLKKQDTLIICGDFGFVWDGSKEEEALLKKLSQKQFTILFVEGSHDNLTLLSEFPEEDWKGGRVRRLAPNILQLLRGYIYNVEGKTLFAFGGAKSQEVDGNTLASQWWEMEMPSREEMERGRAQLASQGNRVDYIITHDCAAKLKSLLTMDVDTLNDLNDYLEEINRTVEYKQWFFGCYHLDKLLGRRTTAVYKEVRPLTE